MAARFAAIMAGALALSAGLGCPAAKKAARDAAPPGMVMVPAGDFNMGAAADDGLAECRRFAADCQRELFSGEGPVHAVYLEAFFIDALEVTQGDYDRCVAAGRCVENERSPGMTGADQPVVGVNFADANNYCSWAGKRLPTEAEWEKAARGTDGRRYPWGDEFDPARGNFCDVNCPEDWAMKDLDDGHRLTAPVGGYPAGASPYGALDMAGNVMEWVADRFGEDYYRQSPSENPPGPASGKRRSVRGGAWGLYANTLRAAARFNFDPSLRHPYIGFRCARD